MTVQLATGNTGKPVTSASDRRLYAGEGGLGCYAHKIGKMCAATLDGPNKLIVQNGSLMINGAHVDLLGNTEYTIPSGLQGKKRASVCGVYVYAMADGKEDAEARTYTGEAVENGEVPDPEYPTGDLNDGATETFMPLYRVVTDGINALEPEPMFEVRLPAKEAWDSQSRAIDDYHVIEYPDGYAVVNFQLAQKVPKGTTPVNFALPDALRMSRAWHMQTSGYVQGDPNSHVGYTSFWGTAGQMYLVSNIDGQRDSCAYVTVSGYLANPTMA